MPAASLPGRPGTLNEEQQQNLRALWTQTLHIFESGPADAEADHNEADKSATKKKKNFFGKKKSSDAEDKYGQLQELEKILDTTSPESLRKTFWAMVKHDDPDGLLLRFLRARKWDVQQALAMMIATLQWRDSEMKVDSDIVRRGEGGAVEDSVQDGDVVRKKEATDFLTQLRLGKSFLHGKDKEGRPMCFVRVRLHKQGEQSEASLERYTVFMLETARLLMHENVDTAAIIFDMTNFSMANMDYGPVKFMIRCFEANYPESLGVVLVHRSPWVFQGIWKVIKGWLDPVVAAKVHFTKSSDELSHFVDPQQIPAEMGGTEDWTYHYEEVREGENTAMQDEDTKLALLETRFKIAQEYEAATRRWIAQATASSTSSERQACAEKLRDNYWQLDKYIRARTSYDRGGIIKLPQR